MATALRWRKALAADYSMSAVRAGEAHRLCRPRPLAGRGGPPCQVSRRGLVLARGGDVVARLRTATWRRDLLAVDRMRLPQGQSFARRGVCRGRGSAARRAGREARNTPGGDLGVVRDGAPQIPVAAPWLAGLQAAARGVTPECGGPRTAPRVAVDGPPRCPLRFKIPRGRGPDGAACACGCGHRARGCLPVIGIWTGAMLCAATLALRLRSGGAHSPLWQCAHRS